MKNANAKEFRMGVEWGYLDTLLKLYDSMLTSYQDFLLYQLKLAGEEERKRFTSVMSSFYSSVMANFDVYLEDRENDFSPKDYHKIFEKNESEIQEMYFLLCKWCQTQGPFATLVEKNDPHSAFKNG